MLASRQRFPPPALSGNRLGIGVQQIPGLIKYKPFFRFIWAVHPVRILKFTDIQPEHNHGVHIANAVMLWKGQDRIRLLLCPPKQQKLNICGSMRIHCKIDSPGYGGGSVDLIEPRPDRVSSHVIHGYQVNGAGQGQMVDTVCFFVPCYAVCGAGSFLSLILHTFLLYAPL